MIFTLKRALLMVLYFSFFQFLGAINSTNAAAQNASLLPIQSFFENPSFSGAVLSPNGKQVAVLVGKLDTRKLLAVYDIASEKVTIVASFRDLDVDHFEWISDSRLVFDTFDTESAVGETYEGPGLFAVNSDGTDFRQLVSRIQYTEGSTGERHERTMLPWYAKLLRSQGIRNSNFIYVKVPIYKRINWGETLHVILYRVNTLTGETEKVKALDNTFGWYLDHNDEPRVAVTVNDGKESTHYLDPQSKQWRKLVESDLFIGDEKAFAHHGFSPDGKWYVLANRGRDKRALYTFDFSKNQLSDKPVFALDHYDYEGSLVTNDQRLLGVRYTSDADETYWFDKNLDALQKTIDTKLPHTVNRVSVPLRGNSSNVLVASHSDVQPKVYLIFNRETGVLNKIGEEFRSISAKQMASQRMIRYTARDGLEIPAYLTIPAGSDGKNLPMVVLVHGGPFTRGRSWGWEPESQFLASRGYAVLEPEFRGSMGFGFDHFEAGWKQWGLAMQDDIADGAKWAISQGIAASERICIAGASYGGYASLMGLVRDPKLFKCGFEWVGVTDIKMMFEGYRGRDSDFSAIWKQYGMPTLIGDPVLDEAKFRETSPLHQAHLIKQPLLLAYGGADRRVPLFHGTAFREAVSKYNKDVEWVVYPDEGHGWNLVKTRVDFWGRVERFLARNIGKP